VPESKSNPSPENPSRPRLAAEGPFFAKIWDSVLYDKDLSPSAKVVYAVLDRYAQWYGHDAVFPSQETIAERAGISARTTNDCLKSLEERGHIRREDRGFGKSQRIVLLSQGGMQNLQDPIPAKSAELSCKNCRTDTQNLQTIGDESTQEEKNRGENATRVQPYHLLEILCDTTGQDITKLTSQDRGRALAAAKRLLAEGVTGEEVRRYVAYMLEEQWRTEPVTMHAVEKGIGVWRASGCASHPKARASPNGPRQGVDHRPMVNLAKRLKEAGL
jgi:DNA-binding MarR family transcriptional regulator